MRRWTSGAAPMDHSASVKLQLVIFHVLDHVADNVLPCPQYPEWYQVDITVKSWLYFMISPELRAMVSSPTGSSRGIWVALEVIFRSNGMARAMNLTADIYQHRQGDLTVTSYFAPQGDLRFPPQRRLTTD